MTADASLAQPHPFEALTPDAVLDALDQVGLVCDGRLMALNSFENRVYLAHLEEPITTRKHPEPMDAVVLKFYRPGRWSDAQIDEEHSFANELEADEVPMVAPLVLDARQRHHLAIATDDSGGTHPGFAFSVSPRRGGRRPELDDEAALLTCGRLLGRLHNVGARHAFKHRPALNLDTFGHEPLQTLLAMDVIPPDVRPFWLNQTQKAIELIAQFLQPTGANAQFSQVLRLHGDCHPGNILWTPPVDADDESDTGHAHFVDLDDARMGPGVQDLWMLLSGERPERTLQLSLLLEGYEQMRDFDRRELTLIEPLRTLRLIHYSAWLARRWSDPIFAANFPWFGSSDYWRGQALQLEEQLEAMQEPPLVV